MRETAATAARETIAELCEDPPGADELLVEVAERVRRVVAFDTGAWMATDPLSRLPTGVHSIDARAELGEAYCRSELLGHEDVNGFDDMFARGNAAASLVLDTDGEPERSWRFREIHVPHGLRDELRLVAGSGGHTWAYGCMTRAEDVPDFSADEVRFVTSIASLLGQGMRRSLVRAPVAEELSAPGMLVLDQEFRIEARTGEADRWLNGIGGHKIGDLPKIISMTAMVAQAEASGRSTGRKPVIRVHVPGRGWVMIHCAALDDGARTAVMLEPADRATLLPLLLALHGLSGREREITELLVAGRSTDDIALALHISKHTVRDHIKAIFAKVGVSSRPELTAALAA